MSLIELTDISFGYDGEAEKVFDGLCLRLDDGWRLGLVGRNGRGKTTLLKILAGELDYAGRVRTQKTCVYFPFAFPAGKTVAEGAEAFAEGWKVLRELHLLGSGHLSEREFGTLSPGEQTRVMLAALFARDDAFPLIDEPTNHLDAAGRAAAAAYLAGKKGFILVSHDRVFLDGCVDHILALNKTGPELIRGDFSTWFAEKAARDAFEQDKNERLKSEIGRLEAAAKRTAEWSDKVEKAKYNTENGGLKVDRGYVGHKSAKMMKRAKATERRIGAALEKKSGLLSDAETADEIRLFPTVYRSETLLDARGLAAVYGGLETAPATFTLKRGERLCLSGGNGCGKSSILKIVAEGMPHAGSLTMGSGLKISYVPQNTASLVGTPAFLARGRGVELSLLNAMLYRLGLPRDRFSADASSMSEGQKKKLLLALSLCEPADLYVWDEPLNYIDVLSRMQIEAAVLLARPAMLFVEHDKAFSDSVATEQLVLK